MSNFSPNESETGLPPEPRGGLFLKYVAMFVAIVSLALAINGASDIWFSFHEQQNLLFRIQSEQARSAADKIGQFLNEITAGLVWETQVSLSDSTLDEWKFDAVRVMRQVPALAELMQLDATGREQYRMSREAPDVIQSHVDHSQETAFIQALANKVYFGPVYFVDKSQPYMTIALAGVRPEFGVIVAQVNLTFIWDVISPIKVGKHGQAYVVDEASRLIAHPDISLVLRKTDMSGLAQMQAARAAKSSGLTDRPLQGVDITGRRVLSTYAEVKPPEVSNQDKVTPPGWLVFAELPIDEAYAPLYDSALRSGIIILVALVLAIFRRTVAGPPHGRADSCSARRCRTHRRWRSWAAHFDQYRRRTRGAGRSIQRHGRSATGILRRLGRQSRRAHPPARSRQSSQVALCRCGQPRFASAAPCFGPLRRATAWQVARQRAQSDCQPHRRSALRDERAVQRAARHLQARCRRDHHQHHGIPGRAAVGARRDHLCRRGAGEEALVPGVAAATPG